MFALSVPEHNKSTWQYWHWHLILDFACVY